MTGYASQRSMNNQTIELIVAPDGATRLETRGFAGDACRGASRFLEAALGRVTTERMTAEFYEQPRTSEALREGT